MFDKGIAIFPVIIYQENKEELFWVSIDSDKQEAIDEFCKINNAASLTELADNFLMEQHEDELDSAHISFVSPIQFSQRAANKIGLEIKSKGEHGLMICWPSFHKNGYQYKIMGTDNPIVLDKEQALNMIQKIEAIFVSKGSTYLNNNSNLISKFKSMIAKLQITDVNGSTINQGGEAFYHVINSRFNTIQISHKGCC